MDATTTDFSTGLKIMEQITFTPRHIVNKVSIEALPESRWHERQAYVPIILPF